MHPQNLQSLVDEYLHYQLHRTHDQVVSLPAQAVQESVQHTVIGEEEVHQQQQNCCHALGGVGHHTHALEVLLGPLLEDLRCRGVSAQQIQHEQVQELRAGVLIRHQLQLFGLQTRLVIDFLHLFRYDSVHLRFV